MSVKPRVFISSTCYDLSEVRVHIHGYLLERGMEPLRSDAKGFVLPPRVGLVEGLLRLVGSAHFFILVIGGEHGWNPGKSAKSITNKEYDKARKDGIPIFPFVHKNVWTLWETHRTSKGLQGSLKPHVNDVRVFDFISKVAKADKDNFISKFESAKDITDTLTAHFAQCLALYADEVRGRGHGPAANRAKPTTSAVTKPVVRLDLTETPRWSESEQGRRNHWSQPRSEDADATAKVVRADIILSNGSSTPAQVEDIVLRLRLEDGSSVTSTVALWKAKDGWPIKVPTDEKPKGWINFEFPGHAASQWKPIAGELVVTESSGAKRTLSLDDAALDYLAGRKTPVDRLAWMHPDPLPPRSRSVISGKKWRPGQPH